MASEPTAAVPTILIVDDTETCAATLDLAFSGIPGVRTVVASTGVQALHALKDETTPVCAVVTDLHLPRLDGFELIRAIRADRRHAHVPIIVTSADTDPRTPRRTLDIGANAYFAKPYSPGMVRRKLEQLLHANQTSE
jgi:CheY-like chemotaxis protein